MGDVTMAGLRADLLAAQAQVLRCQLALQRSGAPDAGCGPLFSQCPDGALEIVRASGYRLVLSAAEVAAIRTLPPPPDLQSKTACVLSLHPLSSTCGSGSNA